MPSNPQQTLQDLAALKAGNSLALSQSWQHAIQQIQTLPLSDAARAQIIQASSSPGSVLALARSMTGDPTPWEALTEAVDHSPHPLSEWIRALELLQEYIHAHGRRGSWRHRIGFLECCSASERHTGLLHAIQDALETYGYDGEA